MQKKEKLRIFAGGLSGTGGPVEKCRGGFFFPLGICLGRLYFVVVYGKLALSIVQKNL